MFVRVKYHLDDKDGIVFIWTHPSETPRILFLKFEKLVPNSEMSSVRHRLAHGGSSPDSANPFQDSSMDVPLHQLGVRSNDTLYLIRQD